MQISTAVRRGSVLIAGTIATSMLTFAPTPAHASELPPEPTIIDRSGSDQDEFVVPDNEEFAYYGSDGTFYAPGANSNEGEPTLVLTTEYLDSESQLAVDGPTYTLTFSSEVIGTEAPLDHVVEATSIRCTYGLRKVNISVVNPTDVTNRYVSQADLLMWRKSDGAGPLTPLVQKRILDGETRFMGSLRQAPGVYEVLVGSDATTGYEPIGSDVVVPPCGSTTDPPASNAKPKGSVKQRAYRPTAVVRMVNREVDRRSIFRVKINPARGDGKTTRRLVGVSSDDVTVRKYRTKYNARVVLKVRKMDQGEKVWVIIDRYQIRRIRS